MHRKLMVGWMVVVSLALLPVVRPVLATEDEGDKVNLPEAAARAIKEAFPGAKITSVGKEGEKLVVYEAELLSKDRKMSVEVTEDGTILQTEAVVDVDDAPASVLRTILKAAKGSVIGEIEISVRKAKIKKEKKVVKLEIPEVTYEAGLTMGSKKAEVIVGADGTLLEKPSWGKAEEENEDKGKKVGKEDDDDDDDDEDMKGAGKKNDDDDDDKGKSAGKEDDEDDDGEAKKAGNDDDDDDDDDKDKDDK